MKALRWRTQEVNEECTLCQQEMSCNLYIWAVHYDLTFRNFSSAVKELRIQVALIIYTYSLYNLNIKQLCGIKLHK
jgi:hypothetical protein